MEKKTKKKEDPLLNVKMEIAKEMGVFEKVEKNGFKSLTSKESGKMGGIIARLKREGKI